MLVMSILFIISIIVEVTSESYWQIVVGKNSSNTLDH
jgi:hypothetical protein